MTLRPLAPTLTLTLAVLLAAAAAQAQTHGSGHVHGEPAASAPAQAESATDLSDGEVRKVDRAGGKVTLRHGPLRNLDMPPMTMVFAVRDPAWLDALRPGDKIRFRAEAGAAGGYTVTALEAVR